MRSCEALQRRKVAIDACVEGKTRAIWRDDAATHGARRGAGLIFAFERAGEAAMTVALILARKGRDVVTTEPHRTLGEVTEILATRNIGAVVIADKDQRVLGILSERDIVREVGKKGAGALHDAVSKHMTTSVVTIGEDKAVPETMEMMTERRFRHLPVVQDGRLVGIVSIGDLVKYRLAEMEQEHSAMREYIASA
jgi:CBS domain-containing protein